MKKLISFLLLPFVIISSCKKDSKGEEEVVYKVKTVTRASGNAETYHYDGQGRIQKIEYTNGARMEYTYSPGLVKADDYNSSGSRSATIEYQLNTDGLLAVTRETYPYPAGPYQYTFNSSRQLSSAVFMDGSNGNAVLSSQNYFYSGKQLDSIHAFHSSGQIRKREMLEYYTDIANTISDQHMGYQFLGVQSPKAKKKHTFLFYNTSGTLLNTQVDNYTYETDGQGHIIREIRISSNGNTSDNRYTYY